MAEKIYLSTNLLTYHNLTHCLFKDVSLALHASDKIGLVGYNGSGKSTLLKLLTHQLEPTSGAVTHNSALRVYEVEQSFPDKLLERCLLDAVLELYPEDERLSLIWQAEKALSQVGFDDAAFEMKCNTMSGGQQTRILLARALMCEPDLLLLDEPSNHLDLPTILWLEQFLLDWRKGFVIVSHDIHLLDSVTNATWIIADAQVHQYALPCSQAQHEYELNAIAQQKMYEDEAAEIKRIETSAKRLAIWGKTYDNENLARKAKSMQKRVEKLKDVQTPPPEPYPWHIAFPGQALSAKNMLTLYDFELRSHDNVHSLLELTELTIRSGEKIALLGRNGSGKSTFLSAIWNAYRQAWHDNECMKLHDAAVVAYYDQMQNGLLADKQIIDALMDYCAMSNVKVLADQAKNALIHAGFTWDKLQNSIGNLSGGERARVMLTGISLINSHFLMLDEPTNHIDMTGKASLITEINAYQGTLMLVSHDRDLIEKTCNLFFVLSGRRIHVFQDCQHAYAMMQIETPEAPKSPQTKLLQRKSVAFDEEVIAMSQTPEDDERALERMIELETLISEDQARKPQHQKPKRQEVWQAELNELREKLDLTGDVD